MGQTIACANQKGGVGKTTTVVNVAAYLALDGVRVLVIDLDPQGNATSGLGADRPSEGRSVYDALVGDATLLDLVVHTDEAGLDLVPSSVSLAGAEVELATESQRERRLSRLLPPVANAYDFVFVDCPPSLGLLTVNALTAVDQVLVPLQCEYYALEGLSQLLATIHLVRDHLNPRLAVNGIVLTMFDTRTNLSADVAAEARRHLGDAVYDVVVPRSVRLAEAPSHGRPIVRYAPESRGAVAYRALATELRERRGASATPPEAEVADVPSGARSNATEPDPLVEGGVSARAAASADAFFDPSGVRAAEMATVVGADMPAVDDGHLTSARGGDLPGILGSALRGHHDGDRPAARAPLTTALARIHASTDAGTPASSGGRP